MQAAVMIAPSKHHPIILPITSVLLIITISKHNILLIQPTMQKTFDYYRSTNHRLAASTDQ